MYNGSDVWISAFALKYMAVFDCGGPSGGSKRKFLAKVFSLHKDKHQLVKPGGIKKKKSFIKKLQ